MFVPLCSHSIIRSLYWLKSCRPGEGWQRHFSVLLVYHGLLVAPPI